VIVLSVATLTSSGCALFRSAVAGTPVGSASALVEDIGGPLVDAKAHGERVCAYVKTTEVAWPEERAMGGAVMVKRAADTGGLFLDGMTEQKADVLMAKVDAKEKVELPATPKNDLAGWVAVLGRNLARYSSRPELPWTFAVIESETPNAFSTPGGYVVVTTGLLKKTTNEAQLAGVLAHEIAHVVHKHSIIRYREAKHVQCVAANAGGYLLGKVTGAAVASIPPEYREAARFADRFTSGPIDLDKADSDFLVFLLDAAAEAIVSGNDKESEYAADATALELVAFAGYDPAEYEGFLKSLGKQGGWFSSHPATDDRVARMKARREGELAPFATGTYKPDLAPKLTAIKK
jgi:predicted Zn-dependent protease